MGNSHGAECRPSKAGAKSPGAKAKGFLKLSNKKAREHQLQQQAPTEPPAQPVQRPVQHTVQQPAQQTVQQPVQQTVQKTVQKTTPPSGESSSDSVFTDPLTPLGFAAEINQCYYSEESVTAAAGGGGGEPAEPADPALWSAAAAGSVCNTFKLNEYRLRREAELGRRLGQLGRSKLSQISLDEHLDDSFASDDVIVLLRGPRHSTAESGLDSMDECRAESRAEPRAEPRTEPRAETGHRPGAHYRPRKIELVSTRITTDVRVTPAPGQTDYKRHLSMSDAGIAGDSNVLRKVNSLNLDKNQNDTKVVKPKFVPEKLDFQMYDKFEGHMLVNWYLSEISEGHQLRALLTGQELRLLAAQFCTHLLAAGVLKQIPDKDVPFEHIFRADLMYYWAHSEIPDSVPHTPGKLNSLFWPPVSPSSSDVFVSPLSNNEFLKTPASEKMSRINGEQQRSPSSGQLRIKALEQEVIQLTMLLERYKAMVAIDSLTDKITKEFGADDEINGNKDAKDSAAQRPNTISVSNDTNKLSAQTKHILPDLVAETSSQTEPPKTDSVVPPKSGVVLNGKSPKRSEKSPDPRTSPLAAVSEMVTAKLSPQTNVPPVSPSKVDVRIRNPTASQPTKHGTGAPSTSPITSPVCSTPKLSAPEGQNGTQTATRPSPLPSPKSPKESPARTEIATSKPPTSMGPPPPPMPDVPESVPNLVPPPPPMCGMGPSPPLLPSLGPPPPPMPGMDSPLPPMAGMGPPPPPMPCMGPPPPPMPGMGPPPPPMPGMGPPPPPMPGMGPPPPPMPGMGPPPPPMPGMGLPPPPPMPGMGLPPPPPMPKSGGLLSPGPASLPPPPAGGWNNQKAGVVNPTMSGSYCVPALRKNPITPPVPMKPLYWTRIVVPATQPEPTVTTNVNLKPLWLHLEEQNIENLTEFADLFSRQVVTRKPAKKKVEEQPKVKAIKVLDSKRSQNVGILAQSLHVEFAEIENAIYNFDTSVVSLEALQQIYEARATSEELEQIKTHVTNDPQAHLDKPEQFLYDLSEISNFANRISCFMFQSEFEDCVSTIDSILSNLKFTCEFMMHNENLKTVFSIILTLGNFMNGGNMTRGQADGFGLEILSRLRDVKSKDNQVTLLHFIVRTYMKKLEDPTSPAITLPVPEPGDVDRAASVNFDDVLRDLENIHKKLDACETRTKKVIEEATPENLEPFKTKMTTFMEHSRKQLALQNEHLDECKAKFISTMIFYQIKPKTGTIENFPPNEFFALWSTFCTDFKDIWKKEQQRLLKEKLKEIKRKQETAKANAPRMKKRENGLKSKIEKLKMAKNL